MIGLIKLEIDDEMTHAYPRQQGGEVEVRLLDGNSQRARPADVVNATADDQRSRFLSAAADVLGKQGAGELENFIDTLERSDDAGQLGRLFASPA